MARIVHLTTVHHWRDPRILEKEAISLSLSGYEVFLVAKWSSAGDYRGVRIVPLGPEESHTGLKGAALRLRRLVRAYRRARTLVADVVHIHDPELIPVARLLKARTGALVVYDMHEDYRAGRGLEGRLIRRIERWAFSWVDHVVLAEDSYRSILEGQSVASTVILNYHAPPEAAGQQLQIRKGALTLLYTGTLANARGLRTMLELARTFRERDRDWILHLVGLCRLDDDRKEAEAYIRQHGLDDVVCLTGWTEYVPSDEMTDFYRAADVGIALLEAHPNFTGSMPTKIFDYLSHGLAVLISNVSAWEAFVDEHGCGRAVPPSDPVAAFHVLDSWASDRAELERLHRNAVAASALFTWEEMGDRLCRMYRSLLETVDA